MCACMRILFHMSIGHTPPSSGVMISKLEQETFMSMFESYWVQHSYGLEPHSSKKPSKLLPHSSFPSLSISPLIYVAVQTFYFCLIFKIIILSYGSVFKSILISVSFFLELIWSIFWYFGYRNFILMDGKKDRETIKRI